ncbi:MAG: hypothetical protein RIS70_3519 [Planctomycetota bacterium]|jgi:predicted dehydrogenase
MKFGVGVLGATGYIGTPYRQEIREASGDSRIVAVCGRRLDLLQAAGIEDGADLVTTRWRDVVEHPEVNLVVICTPDALHYEEVMACVEQRKHVVCEKPIGMNLAQASAMWSAVREAGVGHFVPFWTRYVPVCIRARQLVKAGRLGELRSIVCRWHNPRPPSMPLTWRDNAELSSAGSIADVGSHVYDTLRWITGQEATRALAMANVLAPPKPDLGAVNLAEAIDWAKNHTGEQATVSRKGTAYDYASIAFELESGILGTMILSHAPGMRKGMAPEIELHGTEASLAVHRMSSTITIADHDRDPQVFEKVDDPGPGNRFLQHVFPAIRARMAGEPTEHPGIDDGYQVQRFTDAAAASAREGRWINLSDVDPVGSR